MPTQSNKQTQNVKVVVNNKVGCCPDKPKPRRRKPTPKPPPEPEMPVPVQPVWAKGLSAQAVRPMVYAPSTTIIQPDNVAGNLPAYFESRFTNQQASLEQMRNSIREQFQEVQNELAQQAINNAELQRIARAVAQAEQRTMTTLPSSSSSSVQGGFNGGGDSSGGGGGGDDFSFNTRTMNTAPSVGELSTMFSGMSLDPSTYQTADGGSTSGYSGGGGGGSGGGFSGIASGAGTLETGQGSRVSGGYTDGTSLQSAIYNSFGSAQPASTSTGIDTVNVIGSPTISLASSSRGSPSGQIYGSESGGQQLGSRVSGLAPADQLYGEESGGQQLGSVVQGLAPQDQLYGGSSSSSSAGSRVSQGIAPQVQAYEQLAGGSGGLDNQLVALWGANHPYTRAMSLMNEYRGATGARRAQLSRQIKAIAAERGITGRVDDIITQLAGLAPEL